MRLRYSLHVRALRRRPAVPELRARPERRHPAQQQSRDGAQLAETILTPSAVASGGMQLQCIGRVDAGIMAQPLYVRNVRLNYGPPTNALFVATINNAIYAFDANALATGGGDCGNPAWTLTLPDDDFRNMCGCTTNCPSHFTSMPTPVIDPCRNRMYMLFGVNDPVRPGPNAYFLAALDIRDRRLLACTAVRAHVRDSLGDSFSFDPFYQFNRASLLLDHGSVYIAFGGHAGLAGGEENSHGWMMRYSPSIGPGGALRLIQRGAWASTMQKTPSFQSYAGGIWQAGGGLVADPDGNVHALTGNGHFDPAGNSYADSFVKLSPAGDTLTLGGYFAPDAASDPNACATVHADVSYLEARDLDLASGGPMLSPGTNLLVGGGKTGIAYLVDRRNSLMSLVQSFQATQALANSDCSATQCAYCRCRADCGSNATCLAQCETLPHSGGFTPSCRCCRSSCDTNDCRYDSWDTGPHLHGSPTFWWRSLSDGYLYLWGEKDSLRAYHFNNSTSRFDNTANPAIGVDQLNRVILANPDTMPGGIMSLSANGNTAGIVWATLPAPGQPIPQHTPPLGHAYAFNASPNSSNRLVLLWAPFPSQLTLGKWSPPTIADGRVYVATAGEAGTFQNPSFLVYRLGSARPAPPLPIDPQCVAPEPGPLNLYFATEADIAASSNGPWNRTLPPSGQHSLLTVSAVGTQTYVGQPSAGVCSGFQPQPTLISPAFRAVSVLTLARCLA
jgi:hypothetical protein